jgi:predicted NBD/HSP70 family sugar kinase
MDTRSKILTIEAASLLPKNNLTIATGYFDVLRAADARELAALDRPLMAVVLPLDGEFLAARARAEMAAALRVIDYVLVAEEQDLDTLICSLNPRKIVRLEASHAAGIRRLIGHVHGRQKR